MKYLDTTQQPFVLIDVDALTNVGPGEAAAFIERANIYKPAVWWKDGSEEFSGDIANGDGAGVVMQPDELACWTGLDAVKQIGRLKAPGTFIVTTNFARVKSSETQSLIDAITSTVTSVRDNGGRRFILVTSRKEIEPRFPGLFDVLQAQNPGIPRFEDERRAAGPVGTQDFKAAMGSAAPPDYREPWPWADNPDFIDQLKGLGAEETQKLANEGLHKPALERVRAAMRATQDIFLNRHHAVQMMLACAIARLNLVYLGPPGTAKSELVRAFARTLGIRPASRPIHEESIAAGDAKKGRHGARSSRPLFEYLLTRYTTPEEIFGSADVNLLLNMGVHGRRTDGMLPQAEMGFLDEIFKANTAILNALLSLTNERIFYNMGQAFDVNLWFVVGASNETPAEDELGALYDRFPIRVPCMPVSEDSLGKVIELAHRLDREDSQRHACMNDIRLLSKVAWAQESFGGAKSAFPADPVFKDQFLQMLKQFRQEFRISDRTPYRILRLCRALALLDGASVMGPRQLRAWGHVAPRVSSALDLQLLVRKRLQQWDDRCDDLFDPR